MNAHRPDIDGLRGIACLFVLVAHSLSNHFYPEGAWLLAGTGGIGVILFFVLSASLLTVRLSEDGLAPKSLVAYAVARFVRILPMFWIAVVVYFAFGEIDILTVNLLWTALTFQTWHWHLWTIPIELQFYLLLPVILIASAAVTRKSPYLSIAILLISAVALDLYWQANGDLSRNTLARYLPSFAGGVVVALALLHLPRPSIRISTAIGGVGFFGVVALTILMKSGLLTEPRQSLFRVHNLYGMLWSLATYSVFVSGTVWSRWLSWAPLAAFGKTIYSTYLFHYLLVILIARQPEWWRVPACILTSIAVGWAVHHFVERRMGKLRAPITRVLTRSSSAQFKSHLLRDGGVYTSPTSDRAT
ncbi:acyltransferase family protein [Endobacterium cereale]|nr:acyltransferase [Endobacterium cereale]